MKISAYLMTLLLFANCATHYKGPSPNFSLKGDAAENEIKRFSFSESYWQQNLQAFKMGESGEYYFIESLKPMMEQISPDSIKELDRKDSWQVAWWVAYGAAVAILVAEIADGDSGFSKSQSLAFWGLLGTSVGINYYQFAIMQDAAQTYNRDLRSKFVPTVSLRFTTD